MARRVKRWRARRYQACRVRIARALMYDARRRLTTIELINTVGAFRQLPGTFTKVLDHWINAGWIATWKSSSGTVYWYVTPSGRIWLNRLVMEDYTREQLAR